MKIHPQDVGLNEYLNVWVLMWKAMGTGHLNCVSNTVGLASFVVFQQFHYLCQPAAENEKYSQRVFELQGRLRMGLGQSLRVARKYTFLAPKFRNHKRGLILEDAEHCGLNPAKHLNPCEQGTRTMSVPKIRSEIDDSQNAAK